MLEICLTTKSPKSMLSCHGIWRNLFIVDVKYGKYYEKCPFLTCICESSTGPKTVQRIGHVVTKHLLCVQAPHGAPLRGPHADPTLDRLIFAEAGRGERTAEGRRRHPQHNAVRSGNCSQLAPIGYLSTHNHFGYKSRLKASKSTLCNTTHTIQNNDLRSRRT